MSERENTKLGALILTGVFATIVTATTCNRTTTPPPVAAPAVTPTAAPRPPDPPLHPDVVKARAAVAKIKDDAFCATLGRSLRSPKGNSVDYQAALIDRAEKSENITNSMLSGIIRRQPVLGMNICAVIAALGRPDRSNRSVGRHGEHYQLVYSDRRLYVYLDNYVVTSWQD